MLIQAACAVAIYCQRCGHVHIHAIPWFTGKRLPLYCSNCEHRVASVALRPHEGLWLTTECGACGSRNVRHYSLQQLSRLSFEKIYCSGDHFELGYIGRQEQLQRFLAYNAAAYDAIYPEEHGLLARQQLLLEALNRIHDVVFSGDLTCDCGSGSITAALQGESILLTCEDCGSYARIPVRNTLDLRQLRPGLVNRIVWKHMPFLDAREK